MFKQIHQIIWIGPVHLDVMGIWNIVQGRPGKCLFYLTFMFHTWITIHYFWRDVTFCKQITWEVSALFCWCECLLMVDARLGIRALEPDLVWFHQSTVLDLDDDVWWTLVTCRRDSGSSSFFSLRISSIWFTVILYTKTLMPSWQLLIFFEKWLRRLAVCWMAMLGGLGGVDPVTWGSLASVMATRPCCHLQLNSKLSFIRKLKHFM